MTGLPHNRYVVTVELENDQTFYIRQGRPEPNRDRATWYTLTGARRVANRWIAADGVQAVCWQDEIHRKRLEGAA